MQSTIANGAGEPLFFDTFSGGLGGFSFRKLVSSYSGRWGRAINITTLEERDIGFVGNVADTADIEDLSNGTDTVELMNYDNSFVQLYMRASELQRPILVSSGTLVTLNGLPAFLFPNGSIRRIAMSLSDSSTVDSTPLSIYSLAKINTLTQRNFTVATAAGNVGYWHGGTLAGYDGIGANIPAIEIHSLLGEDLNRRLGTYHWTGINELKIGSNGSSLTTFSPSVGAPAIRNIGVGQVSSTQYFNGIIQEVLLFDTNKEADDSDIRTNINDYYSIY